MTIESENDLQELRAIGRIVALILQEMMCRVEPGMTTQELDDIGKALFAHYDVVSAPQVTYGFPGYTCISVNEAIAHGIPGARVFQPGDLVNIDVSAARNGYFADTGGTVIVPPSSPEKERLCAATRLALRKATAVARAGFPLNGIGRAIQGVAKAHGFSTLKNLGSHGIGRSLHEAPGEIPGHYVPNDRRRLWAGMVITIEPFLSTRSRYVTEADDGWTLLCDAGNMAAQYEHTLVITNGKPILLTVAEPL